MFAAGVLLCTGHSADGDHVQTEQLPEVKFNSKHEETQPNNDNQI